MIVRSSKFRHVFGNPAKKEQCYEGIRVTKSAHDANFCAVNPKFLAIVVESAGGGAFSVLPLQKAGRVEFNTPKVCGHRGPVADIKWNPFDDHVIASASDDATIKLWKIPEGGLTENLSSWIVDLQGHSKRISYIEWHPTAADILLSASLDFQCILWNTQTATSIRTISTHADIIFSISWNRDGSLFATTCKDKLIRVIDPRTGNVVASGDGHQGSKASKVIFLGSKNLLFTTGFSRTSERQYALWDTNKFSKPLKIEEIDSSSGILMPFYDYDTNMVYLAGKGDGNIRYMEIAADSAPYVHFLSQYQSTSPQRGLGVMPKRGVDTSRCEIFRFYKLHTLKDLCEPISMIVPRKSETYQADIYPPTASYQPSLSAEQWINGQNREPLLISLKDGSVQPAVLATQWSPDKPVSRASSLRERLSPASNGFESSPSIFKRQDTHPGVRSYSRDAFAYKEAEAELTTFTKPSGTSQSQLVSDAAVTRKDVSASIFSSTSFFDHSNSIESPQPSKLQTDSSASVQRAVSFHGVGSRAVSREDSYGPDYSQSHRLANRNSSLLSEYGDISDTPTTPFVAPNATKVVRRHRRRRQYNDSSSCSSIEDVDPRGNAWTENPLYSENKSPPDRRKNQRSYHKRALPKAAASSVDLGPLNEVLNSVEGHDSSRHLSKSSGSLVSKSSCDLLSKSSGDLISFEPSAPMSNTRCLISGGKNQAVAKDAFGILLPKSQFKSEPDVMSSFHRSHPNQDIDVYHKMSEPDVRLVAPLAKPEDDFIIEDDYSPDGGRMIDCISVEAPDDTLIKPSSLRASMNSRQRRGVPSSETQASTSTGLRRSESLRVTKSSTANNSGAGSESNINQFPYGKGSQAPSSPGSETSGGDRHSKTSEVVMSARKVMPPSSVPPQPTKFVLPGSGKTSVLPNPFVFTVPVDNTKKSNLSGKSYVIPVESGGRMNGLPKESADIDRQKLLDLCKNQNDEIQFLKQQLDERDAKIRILENRLRDQVVASDAGRHRVVAKSNV